MYKTLIFIIFISLFCTTEVVTKSDLCGKYISRKPTFTERFEIMYVHGHRKFLYQNEDEAELIIKADSTYSYSKIYCKAGKQIWKGKWKKEKDNLLLTDSTGKHSSFVIKHDILYRVEDAIVEQKYKYKHLTLLEKAK